MGERHPRTQKLPPAEHVAAERAARDALRRMGFEVVRVRGEGVRVTGWGFSARVASARALLADVA